MIVFIPCPADGCKPGDFDSEWLPRQCPGCGQSAVIGHGRRWRQAHDIVHESIRVRRGLCNHCDRTLTVLPPWCVPHSVYNLPVREQAMARVADGEALERAAPDCRDPNRIADRSTVRRWLERRVESLLIFFRSPTLAAWDWRAAARILGLEGIPP